jgi:hypothetical protein
VHTSDEVWVLHEEFDLRREDGDADGVEAFFRSVFVIPSRVRMIRRRVVMASACLASAIASRECDERYHGWSNQ